MWKTSFFIENVEFLDNHKVSSQKFWERVWKGFEVDKFVVNEVTAFV